MLRRDLTEGCVVLQLVSRAGVLARVPGDAAVHTVTLTSDGWRCDCPALTRCSHLVAVGMVTAPAPVWAVVV